MIEGIELRERALRRCAVNLIPLLPEDTKEAAAVLDIAKKMVAYINDGAGDQETPNSEIKPNKTKLELVR